MNDLLTLVKNKLKITWKDEDTDREIETIMEDAEIALNYKIGSKIDYSSPGPERRLYLNYCLYAYNDMENKFDSAYFNEIMQLRIKYEVMGDDNDDQQ